MTDNLSNLTLFKLSAAPGLAEIIQNFKNFPELAAPVERHKNHPADFYSIPVRKDGAAAMLPAFTDKRLLNPPFYVKPSLPFLRVLFHSPAASGFTFNPQPLREEGRQIPAITTAEIRLDRKQLSAVIGFLEMETAEKIIADSGLEDAAQREADLGNLHRANYLINTFLAQNPDAGPRPLYAEILIGLGLLQEAYDHIRKTQAPAFRHHLARVLRLTGDLPAAHRILADIPSGSPFEGRKNIELAWLALEEDKLEDAHAAFKKIAATPADRAEGLFGLGTSILRSALKDRNQAAAEEAANSLTAALSAPSPMAPEILFTLGNIYFRSGDYARAESCYRSSEKLRPNVQSKANLCLTLIKTGRHREAAALINEIALTDLNSALRLAADPLLARNAAFLEETREVQISVSALRAYEAPVSASGWENTPPAATTAAPLPPAVSQLEPALKAREPEALLQPAETLSGSVAVEKVNFETFMDALDSAVMPTAEESKRDDFMGRAFTFTAELGEEFNKPIYFNAAGLGEVERKLRLTFIKSRQDPQEALELVRNCSAFLCHVLQERHKGLLVKLSDFDPWAWPMTFTVPKRFRTYPVQRIWKLLWQESLPEPGWLTKYLLYVQNELESQTQKIQGAEAVRLKAPSHPERIHDAQTEHKRTMTLVSSLAETGNIEIGRSGLVRIENILKNNFRPSIPPTADGWRLLRCYGHMLAEIMIKDFKAAWYNVDGNDGLWSMQLPWKTFLFPMGKIYKTVSQRESLTAYYDTLLNEKLRH